MIVTFHPIAVHFPIALWVSAFLFEAGSLFFKRDHWHQTAQHVYWLAVWLNPVAVVTGLLEQNRHHLSHPIVTTHRNIALLAMVLGFLSWFVLVWVKNVNLKMYRLVFMGSLFVITAIVLAAGFWGGRLVYEYAIGVQ